MKKSYLKGIIGAIIGGIIGAIPWVAFSVFNNTMYAILTVLIGIGAVKGYQILNGKISKTTPWIIGAICLIVMTLSNFIFIPLVVFIKEDVPITIANLNLVYDNAMKDLLADYIVGLIFTFLGVSGIIKQMSMQIKASGGNPDEVKFNFLGNSNNIETNKIKDYFLNKKAISPESAIELKGTEKLSDQMIDLLLSNKTLVLTNDNKYYYDEEREEKLKKGGKKAVIISITAIVIIMIMLVVFSDSSNNNSINKNTNSKENVTTPIKNNALKKLNYKAPSDYKAQEEDEYIYYYPKNDLSGKSGFISVSVIEDVKYYDGFAEALEESLKSNTDAKILKVEESENKNKLKVVMGSIEIKVEKDKTIDSAYYIFLDDKVAVVEVLYYNGDAKTLEKDTKAIVDSFKK